MPRLRANPRRRGADTGIAQRDPTAAGLGDFAVIALYPLYQMGALRILPDLPGRWFDSNRANAAPSASKSDIPDRATGVLPFAANLVLASAGGTRATGRHPRWDVPLGGAIAVGVGGAA